MWNVPQATLRQNEKVRLKFPVDVNRYGGMAVNRVGAGLVPQPTAVTRAREASRCPGRFLHSFLRGLLRRSPMSGMLSIKIMSILVGPRIAYAIAR